MTATDELRRLLDERGVEHTDRRDDVMKFDSTRWHGVAGIRFTAVSCEKDDHIYVEGAYLIPSQAIAATLGRGECEQEEGGWSTEGDHARVWLTCGHSCMVGTVADLPKFCPECGKQVKVKR